MRRSCRVRRRDSGSRLRFTWKQRRLGSAPYACTSASNGSRRSPSAVRSWRNQSGHRVAALVHAANHELLPLVHPRARAGGLACGALLPGVEVGGAVHLQRREDERHRLFARRREDGAVIESGERDHRHVHVAPRGDGRAVLAARSGGIAREVDDDLARVERAAGPAAPRHRSPVRRSASSSPE